MKTKAFARLILVAVAAILLLTGGCATTQESTSNPSAFQSANDSNPGLDAAFDFIGLALYFGAPFFEAK
jgi:outer membrane biogenesis lipoprotein LolB